MGSLSSRETRDVDVIQMISKKSPGSKKDGGTNIAE